MEIGKLRHRVTLGRYVAGKDQWGDPITPTWATIAEVWAAVEALTGRLYFEAQATVEQADHRIIIRWRGDVEPGMIVRHGGHEYTVQAVLDREGNRRWLQLMAREVKPA